MAEEFENYDDLTDEARRAMARWEEQPEGGVALAEDVAAMDHRLRETVDGVLHRFDELHARLWELEDKISRLTARVDALDRPQDASRDADL